MRRIVSASAVVLLVACAVLGTRVQAAPPLENPETAQPGFSGLALFSYYSGSLDLVIEQNPAAVESQLRKMPLANVPPVLDDATAGFVSASIDVALKVVSIDTGIERLVALIAHSRFAEARQLAGELTSAVSGGYEDLLIMEQSVRESGQVFQVASVPEQSDLSQAYDGVLDRIARIRQMLAFNLNIIDNWSAAIPGGPGDGSSGVSLQATELTLQIDPVVAFVGDTISFQGTLTEDGGEPLAGRQVDILLNGSFHATAVTGSGGLYRGVLDVPYWYVPQISVQALYYPRGGDVGVYVASLSPEVILRVMFYEATLALTVAEEAYPGLETRVAGVFDYGQWPVPAQRRVQVYLDNALLATLQASPEFSQELTMPSETDLGDHVITVSAQAAGRYSPVVATASLTVTRMTPTVDLDAPSVILAPWNTHFSGRVRSEAGPLSGASVRMSLRGSQTEAASSSNGTFDAGMNMRWGLDLFGSDRLRVEIIPREPWNASTAVVRNVFIVNVANCAGLLAILTFLGIYVPYRWKRRAAGRPARRVLPAPELLAPVHQPEAPSVDTTMGAAREPGDDPRERILWWYSFVLRLVQRLARVRMRPDQTLREFVREAEAALGPLARSLMEFTMVVERLLYSRHEPSGDDIEKTRRLSQSIEKGLSSEAK